jgi:hypothetical protein
MRSYPQVQVQLYDITDDADRKSGEAYLKWIWSESPVFKKQHQELHIWSAGGDGTFKGVMDICLRLGIDLTSPLLFFSVIPCEFLNGWTKKSSSSVRFLLQSEPAMICHKSSVGVARSLIKTLEVSVSRR